jgi:predicted esterase
MLQRRNGYGNNADLSRSDAPASERLLGQRRFPMLQRRNVYWDKCLAPELNVLMLHKIGQFTIILIYAGLALLIVPISGWLLLFAITWRGRGLAVAGLALAVLPAPILMGSIQQDARAFWRWFSLVSAVTLISGSGLVILTTPDGGRGWPDSPVSHRFTQATRFPRFALTNIIPEAEQVNLGFLVSPYLDPIITSEQAGRVSDFTLDLYREMEHDPYFQRLGSAMGWAYAELGGRPFDVGHYYLYVPDNRDDGPLPAIVFLHGSGGNFKSYTWAWAKFAEKYGFVIIAPSFGFGNWSRSGGLAAASRALEDAATVIELDPNRIYLAGLSNGGLGVSGLAAVLPEQFQGVIFISPVMDPEIIGSAEFLDAWQQRPILVITGDADRRIPIGYVDNRVAELRAGGVEVTYIPYPDEDHFLFYSQLTSVLDDIANWLPD